MIILLFDEARIYQSSSSKKQNLRLPSIKKQLIKMCAEGSLIKFISGNSPRYKFMKECEIQIKQYSQMDKLFFQEKLEVSGEA